MRVALPKNLDIEPSDIDDDVHTRREGWLRRLTGWPVLQWPIALPECDPRGVLSAPKFECWKKASDSRVGIAGYHFSFKAGGQVACHSSLEARLLAYFEMCPFVVEIRTQYPQWNREAFLAYCREGRMFPRSELATIDFMLTLRIPGIPYLTYHGVSGKPRTHLERKSVKARHEREARGLSEWCATHEVMTEAAVNDTEYESYRRMFEHMKYVELEEMGNLVDGARQFALDLLATKATGSAGRVVPMIGNRLGWGKNKSFRLLAVALFLGYLKWDVRYLYAPWEPLNFVRP
ncbi:hypothetical protein ACQUJZ_16575 [Ralstonia pseudosolanacearum]|uniref:hypothetical protein n=1 Tax=Ralstonia pseudosolanacearum TaxID=1310165 RepID=UPI000FDA4A74|nr:hypothetical protein [Ralstonia pseudosolanacearum]MCK4140496.1 hypothetical protein [Ralstonia pseudosolanacearum]UQY82404.1 hypothetical protein JNO62_16510 [Ralstonia pseudosolanacearum]